MKKYLVITLTLSIMIFSSLLIATVVVAQSDKDKKIIVDCDSAKADFLKTDALLKNVFAGAYGYVILPNVGKGAIGVGGASGNGIVYEKGRIIGKAKMSQVTIGFQFGGQAYRELIFFETKEAL